VITQKPIEDRRRADRYTKGRGRQNRWRWKEFEEQVRLQSLTPILIGPYTPTITLIVRRGIRRAAGSPLLSAPPHVTSVSNASTAAGNVGGHTTHGEWRRLERGGFS
jgi:hypothetical protein